jgi:ribosomal protein S12 methylthiotransferase accessory factor
MFLGSAVIKGSSATFRLARRSVKIDGPAGLLSILASRCDGETPLAEIRKELSARWSLPDLDRLLAALVQSEVLIDADLAALEAWRHVENPARRPDDLTESELQRLVRNAVPRIPGARSRRSRLPTGFGLRRLLERRRSVRRFSCRPLSRAKILALLWAAYGVQKKRRRIHGETPWHRTVPSGGGLFPLQVHLVNLRPLQGLARGLYAVLYDRDGTVALKRRARNVQDVFRAFVDPAAVRNAQGIIVLSGRFGITARKYGGRSVLYVALEAGHAAQNAMLAAADLKIGALEIGGFIEQRVCRLLGAGTGSTPLTTIAFGAEERAVMQSGHSGPEIEFNWSELDPSGSAPPFHLGAAWFRGSTDDADICWGRDPDPLLAYDKAIAEAWERRACELPTGIRLARAEDLDDALDPARIIAYRPFQYARRAFPFKRYSPRREYGWKEGTDYFSGKRVSILAECVYHRGSLPARLRIGAYTAATTSGVAAYTDREQAIRRAVMELIERDAFMACWLGRLRTPAIARNTVPLAIRRRLTELERMGFRVVVKDLTRALAPVILVFAQDPVRGVTSIATHSAFDPEQALDHALGELESMVHVRLRAEAPGRIAPREVRTPGDHASLYSRREYYRRGDYLAEVRRTCRLSAVGRAVSRRWTDLIDRISSSGRRLVCIDLTPRGASLEEGQRPLKVYRVIATGLLPMTFGYGTEPLGLPEAKVLLGPRIVANLPREKKALFPHPFA